MEKQISNWMSFCLSRVWLLFGWAALINFKESHSKENFHTFMTTADFMRTNQMWLLRKFVNVIWTSNQTSTPLGDIWSGRRSKVKSCGAACSPRFHLTLTGIVEFGCGSHKTSSSSELSIFHLDFASYLRPPRRKGFVKELYFIGILCCFTQI